MKLAIIANPVSGGGRPFRALQRHILRWSRPEWQVEVLTTAGPQDAGRIALRLAENPPDLAAICGGDGTINEVASHLPDPPFPVAVLPAGTANVVARELGLPLNPIRALRIALTGSPRKVDLGELGEGKRRFVFVAGMGFDAYVVANVSPRLKAKLGMAAYAAAIVDCLRTYSFPEFEVSADGRSYRATSCLACNAGSYGGGMLFCPGADMSDGLLDVLVIEGNRRLGLARFLLRAWLRAPEQNDWVHRVRSRSLRIHGPASVLTETDGELAGSLPSVIGLRHQTFPLIVPSKL